MIPRHSDGGLILGGFLQPKDSRVQPDLSLRKDILNRVNVITRNAFTSINLDRDIVKDIVGFRPARKGGIRLERAGNVIHAYGLAGLGYLYAFGVAEKVCVLVQEITSTAKL